MTMMPLSPELHALCHAADPGGILRARLAAGTLPDPLPRLVDIPQPADKHPEGDVWNHTVLVVEAAARLADRERLSDAERELLLLAALVHDLGKITATTVEPDGRIRSYKHEHREVFQPPFELLCQAWPVDADTVRRVVALVESHLPNARMQGDDPSDREVRRYLKRLDEAGVPFHLARWLIAADVSGRETGDADPLADWVPIVERLRAEDAPRPAPLVTGKDLLALGVTPGPRFRELLVQAGAWSAEGWDRDRILAGLRRLLPEG